ncbi:vesicle-fusing ATPase [Nematostella vectensis]|uniref:vesicle-fusing ATPase n=1 Tax=Nematostella vectensis TaxID=45351 RepID=UPI00139035AA|nr:vesicle-fusing ATPase [Nematostella vectensis]
MVQLKVAKCPSDKLSLSNCLIVNENDLNAEKVKHVEVRTGGPKGFIFTTMVSDDIPQGSAGFSLIQRKWTSVSLNSYIDVIPYRFDESAYLSSITIEADFLQKSRPTQDAYDTDKMAAYFTDIFFDHAFSLGQQVPFGFHDKKLLLLVIKSMEVIDVGLLRAASESSSTNVSVGVLTRNTQVVFERAEGSTLTLTGGSKGKAIHQSIISRDWDFTKLGIGGLDKEFSNIVRRAFATRLFPADVVDKMGLKHVKGILLFGPPGTGKTLMARQIGTMLNTREPKIISGPEVLNKFVGESEANIRKLFAEAEEEQKRFGDNSALHLIIFDEFDAVCKSRYSYNTGGTGVQDSVVNQLLAKIDGVEQLNNVLLIGMTNRRDLIDDALLRPGRLEVQVEIGLPDEEGRVQILKIHTAKMRENKVLADDVDLAELATQTKNFTGAEIEGLVRAAQSTAMNRFIKLTNNFEIDPDAAQKILVHREDFVQALECDIKPAFGPSDDNLDLYVANGIFRWGNHVQRILDDGRLLLQQTRVQDITSPITVLLEGPVGAGKTALAIQMALNSDFPFIKLCTPENMIGFVDSAKCQSIKKIFDDADKSDLSCIIVDDIERLLDYVAIGPRFSNTVLQALLVLLKKKLRKGRKLIIIGTTSCRDILEPMGMIEAFNTVIHVPNLSTKDHLMNALKEAQLFDSEELNEIEREVGQRRLWVGIKKAIMLAQMAVQTSKQDRVNKFLNLLEDEHCLRNSLD